MIKTKYYNLTASLLDTEAPQTLSRTDIDEFSIYFSIQNHRGLSSRYSEIQTTGLIIELYFANTGIQTTHEFWQSF